MYSHALITYQDALTDFSQKVAKTFTHVESSFKGYQPYEFQYIKDLAEPNRMFKDLDKAKSKRKSDKIDSDKKGNEGEPSESTKEDEKYFFDLDEPEAEQAMDALELAQQSEASLNNLLELEDKDDELLLQWEEQRGANQNGNKCKLAFYKRKLAFYKCKSAFYKCKSAFYKCKSGFYKCKSAFLQVQISFLQM